MSSGRPALVIAPITHDGHGTLLNTNADTIATEVALALAPDVSLTFAFDHAGVLRDVNDPASVITQLSRAEADRMVVDGVITSGMMPKLENAFRAAERGVKQVRVARYDALDGEGGTWIV
jgi:acetylglutamate kinase